MSLAAMTGIGLKASPATFGAHLARPAAQLIELRQYHISTEGGQLWQIGKHRIVCGDCRDQAAVSRLWADNGQCWRMIWTDSPVAVSEFNLKGGSMMAPMNQADKLMTVDEVAVYLKASNTTIYRLLRRKELPGFRLGSDFRFRRADIDESPPGCACRASRHEQIQLM
jgi:excisionase family DNA binding protein